MANTPNVSQRYRDVVLTNGQETRMFHVPATVATTEAVDFIRAYPHKSYTCKGCGKRVKVFDENTTRFFDPAVKDVTASTFVGHTCEVASKLCSSCYTVARQKIALSEVRAIEAKLETEAKTAPVKPVPTLRQTIIDKVVALHAKNAPVEQDQLLVTDFWTYQARLVCQIIIEIKNAGQGPIVKKFVRLEYTAAMKAAGVKYDQTKHMMLDAETSQFMDLIFAPFTMKDGSPVTYIWITIDPTGKKARKAGVKMIRRMQRSGVMIEALGTRYRILYGQALDNAKLLLVPVDCPIRHISELGLSISADLKSDKRVRRMSAHHEFFMEFDIIKEEVVSNGRLFTMTNPNLARPVTVLDYNMDLLTKREQGFVDGMLTCNLFARLFGPRYAHIMFTGLVGGPNGGLIKGFGHANELVQYDVVSYGTKRELKWTKGAKACFGVLGHLGMHDAYTDWQAMLNFGMYESHLAPAQGRFWMDTIKDTLINGSEAKIRDLNAVLQHIADDYDTIQADREAWATTLAGKLGIGTRHQPVIFRRMWQTAFEKSVDLLRGRIPLMNVGKRLYVAPNPLCFTRHGDIDLSKDTLGARVCAPDAPAGLVLAYRNPSTHPLERIVVENIFVKELMRYTGSGLMFFGADAGELLGVLNGGDMDDSVVVIWDPAFVAKAQTLTYPVQPKIDEDAYASSQIATGPRRGTVGNAELQRQIARRKPAITSYWSMSCLDRALEMWLSNDMSLGEFINNGMLDIATSGEHKAHALENIQAGRYTMGEGFTPVLKDATGKDLNVTVPEFIAAVIAQIQTRPDYVCARSMSNSDKKIDWDQMRKGIEALVKELCEDSKQSQDTLWFPTFWADKISPERQKRGDYILVNTKMCDAYQALTVERDQHIQTARELEWLLVHGLPGLVDIAYPEGMFPPKDAYALRNQWINCCVQAQEVFPGEKNWYAIAADGCDYQVDLLPTDPEWDADAARSGVKQQKSSHFKGFREIYDTDANGVKRSDFDRQIMAVGLYRYIYDRTVESKEDEHGYTETYKDGLPDFVLRDLFRVYEELKLTGLVAYVRLDPRAARRLEQTSAQTPVDILTGVGSETWVLDRSNGLKIGTLSAKLDIPDGTYTMSPKGVIVVWEPNEELTSDHQVDLVARREAGEVLLTTSVDADLTF